MTVSLLAQEVGCYKMSLDCKDKLIKFYETLGYKLEPGNSNAMNMRSVDSSQSGNFFCRTFVNFISDLGFLM